MPTNFSPEELREIRGAALDAVKAKKEEARQKGDLTPLGKTEQERRRVLVQIMATVSRTVGVNIVNKLLAVLPREFSAAIQVGSFVSEAARSVAEAAAIATGAGAIVAGSVGAIAAKAGRITGAAAGAGIVQAQRYAQRVEEARQAKVDALGPFGIPETVFSGKFSLAEATSLKKKKFQELIMAAVAGDATRVTEIVTFMAGEGKAAIEGVRAYAEALADWQGHTRAKTAAEQAWNQRTGRMPETVYRNFSVIYNRANAEFESFRKDPPFKG